MEIRLSIVALVGLGWAIVAFSWFAYQQLLFNGRALRRLENLERILRNSGLLGAEGPLPAGMPIGSFATEFILPTLEGPPMTLTQWRGQRVLLVFFDPRCEFCRTLVPGLAALPTDGTNVVPLIVSTGGVQENERVFANSGIRSSVLLQEGTEVASLYHVAATPAAYLIDEHGATASELVTGAEAVMALATGSWQPRAHRAGRKTATTTMKKSRLVRDGLRAGAVAPSFRLPDVEGREVALESFRGQPLLLVFSDPECKPCTTLAPQLEKLSTALPDLQVVMISRRDAERNRTKARELGLTFPILLQRHWEISRAYGMFATPIGYLIDAEGVIAADVAVGAEAILALASSSEPAQTSVLTA